VAATAAATTGISRIPVMRALRRLEADGRFHHLLWETAGLPQVLRILENLWDRGEYHRLSAMERLERTS
jgi:DNA-binding GntR family transcriptional regulator